MAGKEKERVWNREGEEGEGLGREGGTEGRGAVSYTHLTLPTTPYV